MPIKLTAKQIKERDAHAAALLTVHAKLAEALDTFNGKMEEAWAEVQEAISDWNDARRDAKEWATDLIEGWREEYGDKSERWQASDAGQRADDFIRQWDDLDHDPLDLDKPDELSLDGSDPGDDLADLPEAP